MDRFPWTIPEMRLAGTRSRNARAFDESPASFRMSPRCSPGWMGASFFVGIISFLSVSDSPQLPRLRLRLSTRSRSGFDRRSECRVESPHAHASRFFNRGELLAELPIDQLLSIGVLARADRIYIVGLVIRTMCWNIRRN